MRGLRELQKLIAQTNINVDEVKNLIDSNKSNLLRDEKVFKALIERIEDCDQKNPSLKKLFTIFTYFFDQNTDNKISYRCFQILVQEGKSNSSNI